MDFGLLYGGIALLALCAARFLPIVPFLPSCPLHDLTGYPCPTCGSSRSLVYLAQGDFLSSFALNPLAAISLTGAVLVFFYSVIAALFSFPRFDLQVVDKEKNIVRIGAAVIFLSNWLYLAVYL